jgi:hypothetical protein
MFLCPIYFGIETDVVNQDLSDWTTIISKANSVLQADKARNQKTLNTGRTPPTLTEDQRIGRELYLFAEFNERKSQAAQIYANVGLACLAIRRLLQVGHHSSTIVYIYL